MCHGQRSALRGKRPPTAAYLTSPVGALICEVLAGGEYSPHNEIICLHEPISRSHEELLKKMKTKALKKI